ncbi:AAA family ATPase [Clostridium amazonitimonense]|uniref:AAA family ATPase n=1 Tax=Clostridium amazonitimonense TaxID=1499689 RepID=UPI000509B704|nr:AAA family ATPase [Clostridium amazonitimonense]
MKFSDALLTVDLVLRSEAVPLIIGESGIGKTSLVKKLSLQKGDYLVTIDANLLKEGEIGGLPTVEDYEVFEGSNAGKKKRTIYAVHTKLVDIDEAIKEDENRKVILFIDEINRCEHSVQQELMNLILNREINGYILPKNVEVIAAMNPSNKYDSFENSEYQVVDMDPAQEDRFVWIEMDSDANEWIKWGMSKDGNIHEHILEFISTFPQYLHTPDSLDSIKATPRSWERISKAYRIFLEVKDTYPSNIFYNVVKGNVGSAIAQDFISFIKNYKASSIKPQDIFVSEVIGQDIKDRVKRESHSKLYIIGKNILMYLYENSHGEKEISLFSRYLKLYPVDLRMGIMKEIREEYKENLYKEFLANEDFIELFFSCFLWR